MWERGTSFVVKSWYYAMGEQYETDGLVGDNQLRMACGIATRCRRS